MTRPLHDDPPRLLEQGGGDADLLRSLVAEEASQPHGEALARMWAGVEAQVTDAPPTDAADADAAGNVGQGAATRSGWSAALKGAAGLLMVAGAAIVLWPSASGPVPTALPRLTLTGSVAAGQAASQEVVGEDAPPPPPAEAAPGTRQTVEATAATPNTTSRSVAAPRHTQAREGRRGQARRAPVPELGAGDELRLLERAQRALRNQPRRALALARRHARHFPEGQFSPEREMIAIEALLSLGQDDAARRRGRRFTRRYPTSSHLPRLRQMLP